MTELEYNKALSPICFNCSAPYCGGCWYEGYLNYEIEKKHRIGLEPHQTVKKSCETRK